MIKLTQEMEDADSLMKIDESEMLKKILNDIGDTLFSETVESYINKLTKYEFKLVYKEPFTKDSRIESLYILFNQNLGIMIVFNSYTYEDGTINVNGGKIYYNWSPNDINDISGVTSSGSFIFNNDENHIEFYESDFNERYTIKNYPKELNYNDFDSYEEFRTANDPITQKQNELFIQARNDGKKNVWVGDHDCREGVITKIAKMLDKGVFLNKWIKCPFHWITNYSEHGNPEDWNKWNENVKKKTLERISKMPSMVQECINNTYKI